MTEVGRVEERSTGLEGEQEDPVGPDPDVPASADESPRLEEDDRRLDDRPSTLRGAASAAAIFLASRLVVVGALFIGTVLRPGSTITGLLYMWDAGWYMNTAQNGYPSTLPDHVGHTAQSTIAFFPLFPLLVRHVQGITGWTFLGAGVFVSVLSGLAAALVIWLLVRFLVDDASALRAVALFSFFPASVAMVLPFAEGVAVALSAGCLYFLVRERWLAAGLAAAFATAARPTAMVLTVCCLYAALVAVVRKRQWWALVSVALAPLGVFVYFTFLKFRTGSFTAWFEVLEAGWAQKTDYGRGTLNAVRLVLHSPLVDLNALSATLALGATIAGFIALLYWRPPAVIVVYAAAVSLMAVTSGIGSRPRYMLSAFPLIIAVAVVLRRPAAFSVVLGCSATALGVYAILSTSGLQAIL